MGFQIGATLLDACVLSVLSKEDAYGYVLTQCLQDAFSISESTLYPVLRRLQKDECLETYDQPYMGRNRRYYKITDKGMSQLEQYKQDWKDFRDGIDGFLGDNETLKLIKKEDD